MEYKGASLKQKEVTKMIKRFEVSILCLVETRVKQENCLRIKAAMLPSWGLIHNYSSHRLGRIWVCWDRIFFLLWLSISMSN
jgi:hypothetical protein